MNANKHMWIASVLVLLLSGCKAIKNGDRSADQSKSENDNSTKVGADSLGKGGDDEKEKSFYAKYRVVSQYSYFVSTAGDAGTNMAIKIETATDGRPEKLHTTNLTSGLPTKTALLEEDSRPDEKGFRGDHEGGAYFFSHDKATLDVQDKDLLPEFSYYAGFKKDAFDDPSAPIAGGMFRGQVFVGKGLSRLTAQEYDKMISDSRVSPPAIPAEDLRYFQNSCATPAGLTQNQGEKLTITAAGKEYHSAVSRSSHRKADSVGDCKVTI